MIVSTLIILLLLTLCTGSPIDIPTRSINEASKIQKRTINWTPYINAASDNGKQVGLVGQNSVMIKQPPARALCPSEIAALETCNTGYAECENQRVALEWCFKSRMPYCQGDWIEAQLYCFTGGFDDCESTLNMLNDCAGAITLGPVPTDW